MYVNEGNHPQLFDPNRLLNTMEMFTIDCIVAHSRMNYYYLSGFRSLDYVIDAKSKNFVLIPREEKKSAIAIIPTWEAMSLSNSPIWVPNIIFAGQYYIKDAPALKGPVECNTWDALKKAIINLELETSRVGFELEQLPIPLYNRLNSSFPEMEFVDVSNILRSLRKIKTEEEASRIQKACEISEQSTVTALSQMSPGMTEREVAQNIAKCIIHRGGDVLYVQVATGAVAGQHLPSDRRINKGDIVRTDVAAIFKGYNSDIGRTFVVGSPSQEQAKLYKTSYEALQAGIEAVEPGRPAKDIFSAAMTIWAKAGYEHVRRHHVGHGVGLEAHEPPVIKADNEDLIEIGMVLAVEVPYYVYRCGGFAPEDILHIGMNGKTLFTHAPPEIPVVG